MQTSTPGTHNYAWLFKNVDNSDDSAYTHNVGIESLLINPNTVAGGNGTDAYCIVAGFQLGAGIRDGYGVRIEGGLSNSDAPGQIRNGYGTTHGSVINGLNLGAQCAEGSGNSQNIIMSGMKNGVAKDFQIQVDQDGNGYFETPDGSGALYMGGQVEAQHGIVLPPNGAVSQTLYLQNGTHQSTIGEDSNGNLAVTPGGYGAVQMFPGISGFGGLVLKASQPGVSTSRSVPLYLEYSNAYAAAKIDADGSGNVIVTPANGKALIAPLFQGSLATPSNSSAPGTPGQFMDDANYHYVCVALNTWKRVALESF
jgi:hypothetical protein